MQLRPGPQSELDNTELVSEAAPAWPVCAKWLVMMDAKYRPGHKLYFHPRHKASDIKQPGHNLPVSESQLRSGAHCVQEARDKGLF